MKEQKQVFGRHKVIFVEIFKAQIVDKTVCAFWVIKKTAFFRQSIRMR